MSNHKTKARRLADALSNPMRWHEMTDKEADDAAAELLRLEASEAALLEALGALTSSMGMIDSSLNQEFSLKYSMAISLIANTKEARLNAGLAHAWRQGGK